MRNVTSFPAASEIRIMEIDDLAQRVVELCAPDTNIMGQAAMDVNRFLAEAAMRFASAHVASMMITQAFAGLEGDAR